jgi:hypothetical protein
VSLKPYCTIYDTGSDYMCAPRIQTDQVEQSTTDFPSGGDFSNNFARPVWQDAAVQNYLHNLFLTTRRRSLIGRGGHIRMWLLMGTFLFLPPSPFEKREKRTKE